MFDGLLEPIRRRASDAWRSFLGIPKLFRAWWYGEERRDFARVREEEKEEILRARNLRGEIKEVAKSAAAGASGTGQMEVFHAEGGQVTERRGESSHLDDLVGLAFSGGGIRSATFNLGVLQALANKRYLKQIDYLSTVSGGGYIGAWLTAWIKRKGCAEVEQKLSTNRDESPPHEPWRYIEPNPIRFLRKYSNYLAPRTGLASTDTWALLSVYCRNVLLNLTLLVAAGAAFLLVPLIIISADRHLQETGLSPSSFKVWGATVLLVMVAAWAIAYSFASFSRDVQPRFKSVLRKPGVFVLLPLVVAAICFTYLLARNQKGHLWKWLIAGAVSYSIIWIVGNTAAGVIEATSRHDLRALFAGGGGPEPITTNYFWIFCWWVLANLIGGAFGGWLLFLARSVLHSFASPGALSTCSNIGARILLGPPFLLFSFVLVSILHVGLLGRSFPDAKREWLARLCGMIIMAAVVWVLV